MLFKRAVEIEEKYVDCEMYANIGLPTHLSIGGGSDLCKIDTQADNSSIASEADTSSLKCTTTIDISTEVPGSSVTKKATQRRAGGALDRHI